MAVRHSVAEGLRTVGRREFWSFRVVHALIGGLLTVAGASGALFVGDSYRKQISATENQIATATSRIEAIGAALLQFRVVQSNGVLLGAISTNEGVRSEYRESFTKLMFVLRRGPALALAGELYQHDINKFRSERDELDKLITAATEPDHSKQSWDDVLNFEMTRERQLMDLQDGFRQRKFTLEADKRRLESSLESATMAGFVIQQIGFVVILLAGLIHQHGTPPATTTATRPTP